MSEYFQKKANILSLPGITEDDLDTDDDEIFSSRFMENVDCCGSAEAAEQTYSSPPDRFVSAELWPKSTNIPCWYCDIQFNGRPWAMVDSFYHDKHGNVVILTKGCFHSENCVMKYIIQNYNNEQERDDKIRGLFYLYEKLTGKRATIIRPSYDRTEMKKYSGPSGITAEEYIRKNMMLSSDYSVFE